MSKNLRTFYIVTLTQIFSIVGSAMTGVAVGLRIFNDTGKSTPLMLASLFTALPQMFGGCRRCFACRWNAV